MHFAVLAEPDSFHTQKWTQALLDAGQEVTVFSFSRKSIPGIRCVRIAPRFTFRGNITYFSYLGSGKRLREALLQHKVDIINPINVTPYAVWAKRAGLGPMLSVAMGSDILEYPPKGEVQISEERLWTRTQGGRLNWLEKLQLPAKKWLFRREVASALKASDYVTGDNMVLVHAVRDWFGVPETHSALNRWGIEPQLFEMSAEEEERIRQTYEILPEQTLLTSPRGIKAIYQGDIILEAIERLLRSGKLSESRILMLSAGYAVPPDIEEKASRLEADFPAFSLIRTTIPREDMCLLWNLTDAFVSAPVYDGYSNALSEGRYIGAVPIVNDTAATREVMIDGEHGKVVTHFTPTQLAEGIESVMASLPEWKTRIGPVNKAWVEREATLAVNIRAFVAIAGELLEKAAGSGQKSS